MIKEIASPQNPSIKQAIKLSQRHARNETNLFVIEGYRELKRAADARVRVETLFICPPLFLGTNENALIAVLKDAGSEILCCQRAAFEKLSYRDRPDGLVGIARQMQTPLAILEDKLNAKPDPFLIVAEAIEKPGNLGTILRSADAAGVDGVIVCDRCTDIYNPNVVRASVGTLFTLPVVEALSDAVIAYLKQRNIKIVAATPSASQEFTRADLTGPIAIAVGTEQLGLSEQWMRSADVQVRIPMHGVADSLNVATATTLLLYEAVRQRRDK
ncbi:MAG TPA: RNA methyltransferase [Rhabdochlamydiaceae bacterium]|jgi:TrmH family RNA methyltransferase